MKTTRIDKRASEWEKIHTENVKMKILSSPTLINASFLLLALLRHFRRKSLDRDRNEFSISHYCAALLLLFGGAPRTSWRRAGRLVWRFFQENSNNIKVRHTVNDSTSLCRWHSVQFSAKEKLCWNKWKNSFSFVVVVVSSFSTLVKWKANMLYILSKKSFKNRFRGGIFRVFLSAASHSVRLELLWWLEFEYVLFFLSIFQQKKEKIFRSSHIFIVLLRGPLLSSMTSSEKKHEKIWVVSQ